jgi:protein disulfide-isomerase
MLLRTFALFAALSSTAFSLADNLKWHQTWDAAAKEAKKTKKPILANFTGSDWCGWCIRLDKEVFSTPAFAAWAKKNVVLLELDYPRSKKQPAAIVQQNNELARKYQVPGYPTVLFLKDNGAVIGDYGYDSGGPAIWTKRAETIIKRKA